MPLTTNNTLGRQLEDAPIVASNPLPTCLPPIHPLAELRVFILNEYWLTICYHVLACCKEIVCCEHYFSARLLEEDFWLETEEYRF